MSTRIALVVAAGIAGTAVAAPPPKLDVTSPAFRDHEDMPVQYTCDGTNTPPPLAWSQVPRETKSIAILVADPDAPNGVHTHWLVTGISPETTSLGKTLPAGAAATGSGTGDSHYGAPCPPSGRHRYRFRVYALDKDIAKPSGRASFLRAIHGHILAEGELVGMYERRTSSR